MMKFRSQWYIYFISSLKAAVRPEFYAFAEIYMHMGTETDF